MGRNKRRLKYVNKPFGELPLKQRACFVLYHFAGLTYDEIEKVGVASRATIAQAVKRGYRILDRQN